MSARQRACSRARSQTSVSSAAIPSRAPKCAARRAHGRICSRARRGSWRRTRRPTARYRALHAFVASLGAVPVAIDPDAHDRLLALVSHLPHALANLLLNQVGASPVEGHDPLAVAGASFREMTRVAGANPRIWVDIFLDNAPELRGALAEHRRRVEQLETRSSAATPASSRAGSARPRRNARSCCATLRGDVRSLPRPGARRRPAWNPRRDHAGARRRADQHRGPRAPPRLARAGGTLALLISGEDAANRAASVLGTQGYDVDVAPELGS